MIQTYAELFRVSIQHEYYNQSGGACRDFEVLPAPASARVMRSLGMLFRDYGAGFSVHIEASRIGGLIDYAKRRYRADADPAGYWSWLTFFLIPRSSSFIGITAMPLTASASRENAYLCNLTTHRSSGALVLGEPSWPEDALFPVCGATLSVSAPNGSTLTLADISGKTYTSIPAHNRSGQFDLAELPYGKYSVTSSPPGAAGEARVNALYVPSRPTPLCVLDLLLTQPASGAGDVPAYPVVLSERPAIRAVDLTVAFQSRDTYWQYFIVSANASSGFGDELRISGEGVDFEKSLTTLPNGDSAVQFSATTALPLRERSPYAFELTGRRRSVHGSRDHVMIKRLPTAPAAPVWPAPSGDVLSGTSQIYVYV